MPSFFTTLTAKKKFLKLSTIYKCKSTKLVMYLYFKVHYASYKAYEDLNFPILVILGAFAC
jgi:hypothetical protein